ncbi:venom metalloproteinase antarease-like TtrivMP_A [Rhipicephalus sanguineus]|uniref:venom metalloproteinase antarease-like TtrivMP_A n=1 Tax=Rhipicephalus sanguineus TaxID=34632 RepID=UPI001893B3EF|nr:venom metalloproteinase antarease-like TtrivMP_A [Rhipicephalus sanguineus]
MKHSTSIFFLVFIEISWLIEASRIVYPRMLQSRAENGVKVLKISEDITLNLRKSSVFSEEFLIHTTHHGEPIAYHMSGAEMEKNLYDDHEQMAAVDVSQEDGLSVEGVLGHTLRIRPLEGMERAEDGTIAHEIYEVPQPENAGHQHDDYGTPDMNTTETQVESRLLWYKAPRLPLLINPEVYVVVDHFICAALKYVEKKIARYVAILTASANLRYRSVVQPRVQLVLVGITVTKSAAEEPYMEHVQGYQQYRNILYGKTIQNFNEYVKQQVYFQRSDIIFLLTGMNMSVWENGELKHWVGGYAYVGAACTAWKVGMSEERVGSYYGVYVYAHELAHSLGCAHDGDDASNWPTGHIGSKDCDWDKGFMMSYKFIAPNMYRFSYCCQREITNMFNRPEYECLRVRNRMNTGIFSSKLPGAVSSRQTYCQKVYYEYTHVEVDRLDSWSLQAASPVPVL